MLIAGAGLAASRCAETLRAGGFGGRIVIAGEEAHAPYERPALSKELLTGHRAAASLALRDAGFWAGRDIELRPGARVDGLDPGARRARVGGEPMRWGRLVLATGARARPLPSLPIAENVHHLRTLDDARALRADIAPGGRLVVIGAGFVGAEAASSAIAAGAEVTVVEALPLPFAAVLGSAVGRRLAARYREGGVDLRLGSGVAGVERRRGRVRAVRLADGSRLPCTALLVAVGARPAADLAAGLVELATDGGVPTDPLGGTAIPGVHACGDVASPWRPELGRHARLEHWTAAASGGAAVAREILGHPPSPAPPPYFWSDQFGWRLQMIGHAPANPDPVIEDRPGGFLARYRDLSSGVIGALAVNRPGDLSALRGEMAAAGAGDGATAAAGSG